MSEAIFTGALLVELQELTAQYPDRRSACLPALHLAQRATGFLSEEAKLEVAERLGLHVAFVESVATFYSLYLEDPPGQHIIHVCTTLSCMLGGSDETVSRLEKETGVHVGGTSADGRFSIFTAECLGACQHAPVARVDGSFRFRLTEDRVPELLQELTGRPRGSASPDLRPEQQVARAAVSKT